MARGKKELITLASQIGEAKQAIMMLKNQQEEIKKKIKDKEVELEQLENQQKLETMAEIIKIAEGEGVTLNTILTALQKDKSLISLIADEAKTADDEVEDIPEDVSESSSDVVSAAPNNSANTSAYGTSASQSSY